MSNLAQPGATTVQTTSNRAPAQSVDDTSRWTPSEWAHRGEICRLAGNYSDAISFFDEAIKRKDDYGWAHAHRGAARAVLGNFIDAWKDFEAADKSYQDEKAAWLHAQKGELCRLWARAIVSNALNKSSRWFDAAEFEAAIKYLYPDYHGSIQGNENQWPFILMNAAVDQFNRSMPNGRVNPWALAHRGAVRTMMFWLVSLQGHPDGRGDADFSDAIADFELAVRNDPTYGWAYAFWCVLYALKGEKMPEALDKLAKAHLYGLDRNPSMVHILMGLYIYSGVTRDIKQGVCAAWEALQIDSDETLARYFVADGLSLLVTDGLSNVSEREAETARMRARMALRDAQAQIFAMEGGLDCLDGDFYRRKGDTENANKCYASAKKKLKELKKNCDLEALSLVKRDPAWRSARPRFEQTGPGAKRQLTTSVDEQMTPEIAAFVSEPDPGGLQAARAAYEDLFDFRL